jgi:hypothetical protein
MVPNITVFEVVMSQEQILTFNRQLTGILLHDFNDLCGIIHQIHLSGNLDQVIWRWNGTDKFSTHSAYEWLMFRGVTSEFNGLW